MMSISSRRLNYDVDIWILAFTRMTVVSWLFLMSCFYSYFRKRAYESTSSKRKKMVWCNIPNRDPSCFMCSIHLILLMNSHQMSFLLMPAFFIGCILLSNACVQIFRLDRYILYFDWLITYAPIPVLSRCNSNDAYNKEYCISWIWCAH